MKERNERLTRRTRAAIASLFRRSGEPSEKEEPQAVQVTPEAIQTPQPAPSVTPESTPAPTDIPEADKIIELKHVTKVFDGVKVIDDENFYVRRGEFLTLLGPSGCGKSTTLRMIAGFETPSSGDIILDGRDIVPVPPYKRPVNTVFQHYALFPNLDVYGNVAFGLKLKKVPVALKDKDGNPVLKINRSKIRYFRRQIARFEKDPVISQEEKERRIQEFQDQIDYLKTHPEPAYRNRKLTDEEIDDRVMRALQIVDLDEMEDRSITKLSGGQQQRVAIARAICLEPKILLLDEPLGALDLKMRKDMQLELKEMHRKLGITFIYVTHDQEEALTMSDRVMVMSNGLIQQIGTPTEIYNEPKNAFVADFIGDSNIYNGVMTGARKVRFLGREFTCVDDFPLNQRVDVVVRPEDVELFDQAGEATFAGHIDSCVFKGIFFQYSIMVGSQEVIIKSTRAFPEGSTVFMRISPDGIHIMNKELSLNVFTDCVIDKHNQLTVGEATFEIDVTKLLPNSKLDDDGYLVQGEHRYDLSGLKVTATIRPEDVRITDDTSEAQVTGTVDSSVWKGDHYLLVVHTSDDEDYVVSTPYAFTAEDTVGLSIPAERIVLKVKGDLSAHEV